MARNLAKCGFEVHGYDLYQPSVDKLVEAGGKAAPSPAKAAESADVLVLMVVNNQQADAVLFDPEGGAVAALRKEATIILCSTTAPAYQHELRRHIDEAGRPDVRLLDCPVSGGSIRAANGTLSIFSSGPDAHLDAVADVLNAMADPLYRIPGGISMGSVAKMCHQHQAATNIIMVSEAMGLAAVAGLDTKTVYEAINQSAGWSWMFENRGPHMLGNDWGTVHSAVSIILKDAKIVAEHARNTGFPLPLENAATELYIAGTHAGFTKEDDAGLVRLYLPKDKQDAVGQLAKGEQTRQGKGDVTVETIVDVLAGVHLASTSECMKFAQYVGMDVELLVDIITRGAGSSNMFKTAVPQMLKAGDFSLHSVKESSGIQTNLKAALDKAAALGQPLPMAAAAFQQMLFDR